MFFESLLIESTLLNAGVSSLGVPGMPWHPQILADQLTLSQRGGSRLCPPYNTGTPGFSDIPTALLNAKNYVPTPPIWVGTIQVLRHHVFYFFRPTHPPL